MFEGICKVFEKKIGKGVKRMLVAKENRVRPRQKMETFSYVNFSLTNVPSRAFETMYTPR